MAFSCEDIIDRIEEVIVDGWSLSARERMYVTNYLHASVNLLLSNGSVDQMSMVNQIAYAEENAVRVSTNTRVMTILLEDIDTAVARSEWRKRSET